MKSINEVKHLYDMGFGLLLLYPKSKRPIGEDWQHGERKHLDILKKKFKEQMNVGVRLGAASIFKDNTYLCVLDCDVKSSDAIHLKEMEVALLNFAPVSEFAPRVLSGRGGGSCHIYFRTKEPQQSFKALRSGHKVKVYMPSVEPSKGDTDSLTEDEIKRGYRMRLAWEVDVYGEGKQVVIPPSVHPDTLREYKWESELTSFDQIPLIAGFTPNKVRLTKSTSKAVAFSEVDLLTTPISDKHFDLIVSGEGFDAYPSRSEALFAALNALINAGLSDEQIYTVLTDSANFMAEKPLEAGKGSIEASARWLQTQIAKIRGERSAEATFKDVAIVDDLDEMLSDEEADEQMEELAPWQTKLKGKDGAYKNTANNLHLILSNAVVGQTMFAYDEFNQSLIYTCAPPWGTVGEIGRELRDADDVEIKVWLSKHWGIESSPQSIAEICMKIGLENKFHPVRRYLRSLKWDEKPRLDNWLREYMGATGDDRYLQSIGRKTMCAAVARVMHPGCKFDHVLILEGDQGIGKSSAVSILAGDWFVDSLGDIENKDVVDIMRGRWIVEIGELASMDKSSTNSLKSFITRQFDVTRKAFGRRAQQYPRQCIFIGTTNDMEYLKDATGGRRFWPTHVAECNFKALQRDRDQLWAEALVAYELGEALYLDDPDVRDIAAGEQSDRFVIDEICEEVKKVLGHEEFPIDAFTFQDVWGRMWGMINTGKTADFTMQSRIKKAFRTLGYARTRSRVEHERAYVWRKKSKKLLYKEY